MQIQPYLFFEGRCDEAIEFYRKALGALAEGGQILMPLAKTFFASRFGMAADRFGVSWMVYVAR